MEVEVAASQGVYLDKGANLAGEAEAVVARERARICGRRNQALENNFASVEVRCRVAEVSAQDLHQDEEHCILQFDSLFQ